MYEAERILASSRVSVQQAIVEKVTAKPGSGDKPRHLEVVLTMTLNAKNSRLLSRLNQVGELEFSFDQEPLPGFEEWNL